MVTVEEENGLHTDGARRLAAGAVMLVAGTMLAAWLADLQIATRTDNLAPMSPLACVGFLAAAGGVWLLPGAPRLAALLGALAATCGLAGLLDVLLDNGDAINDRMFGADIRISVFTAAALVLLGLAVALDGRQWPITRRLTAAAGLLGGAAAIGFLLGVPLFFGASRPIQMSWQAALCILLTSFAISALHGSAFFSDSLSGRFARRTLPAVIGIPVVAGALATAGARAGWWPFSVAAWLMTLAAVTGLALVVAMAVRRLAEDDRRLTELAIRDPLTGAYNRRHFLAEATAAARRTRRYGEHGAIAVIDLDHFKEVNDQWGHATGDEVLVRVHRALRTRLRSTDVLGRVGGDEFAAVILHVDPDEALQVADELRDAVACVGAELIADGRRNRLAASVGVAVLDGAEDVESLVDLADQRMYDDKRGSAQKVQSGADH
jgi:diguanylate cyclase (GGDEF)-like protein